MKKFLVIKTGRTYDDIRDRFGCFDDWMTAGLGVDPAQVETVSVFEGATLPARLDGFAGVVITGSPAMVTERHPWSEATAAWLRDEILGELSDVPIIGICYGHQLLAHALGGRVDWNPRGREIGTVPLRATAEAAADPLFGETGVPGLAHVTHMQSVVELPPGAVRLAESDLEPHHAFRVGRRTWGLQFHPEFTDDIMRAYVEALAPRMAGEGLDPGQIHAGIRPAESAAAVLRRFASLR